MRRVLALAVAGLAVVAAVAISSNSLLPDLRADGVVVPAGGPLPLPADPDPDDPEPENLNAPPMALAPPSGAVVQQALVRLLKPKVDYQAPRRVGIQIGHWQTTDIPKEYGARLATQTGTSWAGITEVDVSMEVAERMATILRAQGVEVDILPTTVPVGYLADVFIALHCDGDGVGAISGFKMSHGSRRGPFEDKLLNDVKQSYGKATGLDYDAEHVSRNMTGYFAFNWSRFQHSASPFTPAVILEMGFLSHPDDRDLLVNHPDVVAKAITDGILRFLDSTPRAKIFGDDLLVPTTPLRPGPFVPPSPSP
ncbi:MAG TPA: N-acetylmuramoyl-L-alanine amidase [Candidatus Limnocylindria bacterium]|nr:N-acetylmuramoyl-L-alanine amidase [Candidatus Limnocylindria bacterium]